MRPIRMRLGWYLGRVGEAEGVKEAEVDKSNQHHIELKKCRHNLEVNTAGLWGKGER